MSLPCRAQSGRNPVAMRFRGISAKSLFLLVYGPRNSVAIWRNAVWAKSLKTQQSGRPSAGTLTKVREGGPLGGLLPIPKLERR